MWKLVSNNSFVSAIVKVVRITVYECQVICGLLMDECIIMYIYIFYKKGFLFHLYLTIRSYHSGIIVIVIGFIYSLWVRRHSSSVL